MREKNNTVAENKIISLVLLFALGIFMTIGLNVNAAKKGGDLDGYPTISTDDGWEYQIKANEAVVIGYIGPVNGTVTIPSEVTIPDNINDVRLSKKQYPVGAIGTYAFSKNSGRIPIGDGVFTGPDIISLNIPYTVDAIGDYAFSSNENITTINFTGSPTLKNLGMSAFDKCSNLRNINFPASLQSIGFGCFKECSSLQTVSIPVGVTEIQSSSFKECTSLVSVTLPNTMKTISGSAFEACSGLRSINLPDSIEILSSKAFCECYSLSQIHIPTGIKSIGNNAFEKCYSLTNLYIPGNVKSIGEEAFINCNGIGRNGGQITLNEGLTKIGSKAFYDIPELKSITIPYSVTEIESKSLGYYESQAGPRVVPAFAIYGYDDTQAQKYAAENGFPFVELARTGVVIEEDKVEYSTTGKLEVELTSIKDTTITSFNVPKTVSYKGKTYKVTGIGTKAFNGCKLLKTVKINGNVTKIGERAFFGCKALETVVIGTKVTDIGKEAFYKCSKLKKIKIKSKNIKTFGKWAFKNINKKAVIYVPKAKLKKYKSAIKKSKIAKTVKVVKA